MPPAGETAVMAGGVSSKAGATIGASVKGKLPENTNSNTSTNGGDKSQGGMTARERLRAHLARNIQMQQESARLAASGQHIDTPPSTGAPASPKPDQAESRTTSIAVTAPKGNHKRSLENLYSPIEDTRLGKRDLDGNLKPQVPPEADILTPSLETSPTDDAVVTDPDSDGPTDTPPFFGTGSSAEWSGDIVAVEGIDPLYCENEEEEDPTAVVDNDWDQSLYDEEGLFSET